jgi:regulator of protease activity HflC (stomatin/prohibitin superfamily)
MGARSCELERCATADQGPLMRTTLLIRQLAESVTRNAVANMHLEEALRDRRSIIERLKAEIDAVVRGWGVEVASIEIVDIRIASKEVFGQMQARFREQLRQEAKGLQIAADEEIRQQQLASASRVGRVEHDQALAGVTLKTELQQRELVAREAFESRRQQVDGALALEKAKAAAELQQQETTSEAERLLTALQAELERQQRRHVLKLQERRELLELVARKNEIMGQVNEAYRSQRMIDMLPRLVEGMKAEKTTVFANSLPGATLEGLASSLLSMAEVAGLKLTKAS